MQMLGKKNGLKENSNFFGNKMAETLAPGHSGPRTDLLYFDLLAHILKTESSHSSR
jgi:hypothetical protein